MHQRLKACEACRVALCALPDVTQSGEGKKSILSMCYMLTWLTMCEYDLMIVVY